MPYMNFDVHQRSTSTDRGFFRLSSVLLSLLTAAGLSLFGQEVIPLPPKAVAEKGATDPQELADRGRALLQTYRKATTPNPQLLIDAQKKFTSSKAAFAAAGDLDSVAEMDANLAWCQAQIPVLVVVADAKPSAPPSPAPASAPTTLFTRPAPAIAAQRAPFPSETERKHAVDQLRTAYAADYAKRTETGRRHLAAKLLREAERNIKDPVAYAATLNEACKVALDSGDYLLMVTIVDTENSLFSGLDPLAEKQTWLKKSSAKVVPAAIAVLLQNPLDPAANVVVGKYCAIELGRLDEAVPLLALGNDTALRSVAKHDLATTDDDMSQTLSADDWYQLVKSGTGSGERFAWLSRAQHWYLKAQPTADGLAKKRIDTRLAEIDKILPLDLDKLDWRALTPTQWDKLSGLTCVVPMRVARSGPFCQLAANQTIRVVPHPSDQWSLENRNGKFTSTWTGLAPKRAKPNSPPPVALPRAEYRGFLAGELLVQVGDNPLQRVSTCEGPGAVWLVPNRSKSATNDGEIRVKLLPVE